MTPLHLLLQAVAQGASASDPNGDQPFDPWSPPPALNPFSKSEVDTTLRTMGIAEGIDPAYRGQLNAIDQLLASMSPVAPQQSFDASQDQKTMQQAPTQPAARPSTDPGKVFGDSKTGAERVNYYTGEHGVRAITDPKTGRVTLTNIGEDGQPTAQSQKQVYGFNPKNPESAESVINPTTPQDKDRINKLMDQIAAAETSEQAEVLTRQLRLSVANETTRLEQQAYSFAEQELGIATLKEQAEALRARDEMAARVGGVPFVSPQYMQATQLLSQRQQAANARANEWLTRNVTYNRLKATETNAAVLVDRKVTKLGAAEVKEAEKQQRFTAAFESIPESQRELVYRVDPSLRSASPETVVNAVSRLAKNKDFEAFVTSQPTERLALAVSGNSFAFQTIAEDEAAITNRPVAEVAREMQQIASMEPTQGMVKAYVERQLQALPPEQRKVEGQVRISAINQAKMGTGKDDKARYNEVKSQILAQEFRALKTRQYMSNVESWGIQNPALTAAIEKAHQTTGSTSLDKVMAAYLNGKEGPEALAAANEFKAFITQATERNAKSLLGSPDQAAMLNVANNTIIQGGSLTNWIRQQRGMMISTNTNANTPTVPGYAKSLFTPGL